MCVCTSISSLKRVRVCEIESEQLRMRVKIKNKNSGEEASLVSNPAFQKRKKEIQLILSEKSVELYLTESSIRISLKAVESSRASCSARPACLIACSGMQPRHTNLHLARLTLSRGEKQVGLLLRARRSAFTSSSLGRVYTPALRLMRPLSVSLYTGSTRAVFFIRLQVCGWNRERRSGVNKLGTR